MVVEIVGEQEVVAFVLILGRTQPLRLEESAHLINPFGGDPLFFYERPKSGLEQKDLVIEGRILLDVGLFQ